MQNQNVHSWSWGQASTPGYAGTHPMLPTGFPPPGVEQNPLLSGYQQMYGNPTSQQPPDYGQWTATQLQQWQQWQQWQEKYQQWQAQYGKKYAESLAALVHNQNQVMLPSVASVVGAPKPVEPVTSVTPVANPPLPANTQPVPPPPPEEDKPPLPHNKSSENEGSKNGCHQDNPEELSEAEKTFDVQFKQWEGQFNEWKKQNQDHPDKAQYKEYENKWETWREQLLQRREQMRRKRLSKVAEQSSDAGNSGKTGDSNSKTVPMPVPPPKVADSSYCYKTQSTQPQQSSIPCEPPKFENKLPFFDKPQDSQSGPPSFNNVNHRCHQENLNKGPNFSPGNFSFNVSKEDQPRTSGQFPSSNPSLNRNQGLFGNPSNNFDAGPDKAFGQCSNPRFGSFEGDNDENFSKFRNFDNRQRFGGDEKNFGPPQRFPGNNFRNEREFNQQRFFENARDTGRGNNGSGDFRSPNMKPVAKNFSAKPKVPSLFDITVEKPPNLSGPPPKSKIWEKDNYYEDPFERKPEERESERIEKAWGNKGPWNNKNVPSPWIQPWELEKLASQKPPENRVWERDPKGDGNTPWLKDIPGKQEIDKAELSGYVGNILAKLGNFNVMPPNLQKPESVAESNVPSDGSNRNKIERLPDEHKLGENNALQNDQNRGTGNFGPPRDFDERGSNFNSRSFAPTNFDRLDELRHDVDDRARFDGDHDVDDRQTGRDSGDRMSSFRTGPFGRDDRFFGRDHRQFGRPGRDERRFGRFSARDDVDERYGNRNGRRGFDRVSRDDRNGRFFDGPLGPFDRFGRGREPQVSETIWNPQVFDYSQGRPQKLQESDDGFKISTVVDYSHGENKQMFDYGHGESNSDKLEMKSFDYGHKTEAPTVIDYGHGVDKDSLLKDSRREKSHDGDLDIDSRGKSSAGISPSRRSRSPRNRLRSHSRSPHSRYKRGSASPPYRGNRPKNIDRLGRQLFRKDKDGTEDKLSPRDGDLSKHSFDVTTVLVEDLICLPGRETRPSKLVFIMRGIPGSGKTYVTKLIKDKEVELGGDAPRILSLDDYFMTEVEKEVIDKETGRKVKTKVLEYEYEAGVEPHYRGSLLKAFKKTVSDGFFSFILVDSVNEKIKDFEEMWSFAKQKGFQVYVAEMDNDVTICKGRNIHKRTEKEISDLAKAWEPTPPHYLRLDVRSLLQSDAITEVEMEVVSDTDLEKIDSDKSDVAQKNNEAQDPDAEEEDRKDEKEEEEEDESAESAFAKSRWDQFENSEQNLDRLDGLKRRREGFHATMEDYLQLPDDFDQISSDSAPGKKKVRWADLEERRQQEKMRAIGFVVGQTDWSRMTDPTFGESALTRTKYI